MSSFGKKVNICIGFARFVVKRQVRLQLLQGSTEILKNRTQPSRHNHRDEMSTLASGTNLPKVSFLLPLFPIVSSQFLPLFNRVLQVVATKLPLNLLLDSNSVDWSSHIELFIPDLLRLSQYHVIIRPVC